jgi:hypothetical protein
VPLLLVSAFLVWFLSLCFLCWLVYLVWRVRVRLSIEGGRRRRDDLDTAAYFYSLGLGRMRVIGHTNAGEQQIVRSATISSACAKVIRYKYARFVKKKKNKLF